MQADTKNFGELFDKNTHRLGACSAFTRGIALIFGCSSSSSGSSSMGGLQDRGSSRDYSRGSSYAASERSDSASETTASTYSVSLLPLSVCLSVYLSVCLFVYCICLSLCLLSRTHSSQTNRTTTFTSQKMNPNDEMTTHETTITP